MVPIFVAVGTAVGASAAAAAVVGGLMVVGTALQVVGAITGNKDLSRLGGVMSLAGGVGGLASGAWASASTSIAASSSSDITAQLAYTAVENGAATGATGAAASGAADVGGLAALDSAAVATEGAAPGLVANEAANAAAPVASEAAATPVAETAAVSPSAGVSAPDPMATVGADPSAVAATPQPMATTAPSQAPDFTGGASTGAQPAAAGGTSADKAALYDNAGYGERYIDTAKDFWGDSFKKLTDWTSTPGGGKVVSGLVQGVGNNMAQQSGLKTQYDLQQKAIEAQRARYSASLTGLTVPVYQAPKKG